MNSIHSQQNSSLWLRQESCSILQRGAQNSISGESGSAHTTIGTQFQLKIHNIV